MAGEQQSQGFELSATGKLTKDLDIIATYTNQDTEITEDFSEAVVGNGLSAAPENMASIWANYRLDALYFGLGAQYSSGDTYWRRARAYYETGSYTMVQAMAGYDFTEQLSVQLNIDNLTDEKVATDYSARGHFRPADPRVIKLSARYSF